MQEAKILVLEDLDKASGEVLGTLWPLVESLSMSKPIGADASLRVFGRKTVQAQEGFTLFATTSTAFSSVDTPSPLSFLGAHKWSRVAIMPPSKSEVETIINASYPRLGSNTVKAALLVWNQLSEFSQKGMSGSRQCVTRDLMKWCARIDALLGTAPTPDDAMEIDSTGNISFADIFQNPVFREEMFLEARDVFLGAVPTNNATATTQLRRMSLLLSGHFSITEDRLQWLLEKHTPQIQFIKSREGKISNVILNSISLPVHPALPHSAPPVTRPFALHRQSLTLLASIARCIQLNEPILLTGETGTGKTATVTYLASILSQTLVSLNLSHQTDSSDLLGGFKPIEASGPAQHIQERFMALFSASFSREKNLKFEEAVRIALTGKKWKRAVLLWREAAEKARDRIRQKKQQDEVYAYVYSHHELF